MAPEIWALVHQYFKADLTEDKHAFLNECTDAVRKVNIHKVSREIITYTYPKYFHRCLSQPKYVIEIYFVFLI